MHGSSILHDSGRRARATGVASAPLSAAACAIVALFSLGAGAQAQSYWLRCLVRGPARVAVESPS
jgi:hypothetical protein